MLGGFPWRQALDTDFRSTWWVEGTAGEGFGVLGSFRGGVTRYSWDDLTLP